LREYGALLQEYRALLRENRVVLRKYKVVLPKERNLELFSRFGEGGLEDRYFKHRALSREYKALMQVYQALLILM